jgi:hypothetical protein
MREARCQGVCTCPECNRELVAHWYATLTEQEAKALIGNYAGAMEYGVCRSWAKLNENVRMVLRREYRRITSKSEVSL